jgi:hypothetical protein
VSLYGPLVTGHDIEQAIETTLRAYFPGDLGDLSARLFEDNRRGIEPIRSWSTATTVDRYPEQQLPALIIVSTGTAEPPTQVDGRWSAWWDVGIAAITAGVDGALAARTAKWYAAVARRVLLQHPTLGGLAGGLTFTDESYDVVPFENGRTHAGAEVGVSVLVSDLVDAHAGPTEPPADPWADPGDFPAADEVTMAVQRVE